MERDQATRMMQTLLKKMVAKNGSDLFITASATRPAAAPALRASIERCLFIAHAWYKIRLPGDTDLSQGLFAAFVEVHWRKIDR